MITLVSLIVSLIVLVYILAVIPKRLNQISNKCDILSKNQGVIERKIDGKNAGE